MTTRNRRVALAACSLLGMLMAACGQDSSAPMTREVGAAANAPEFMAKSVAGAPAADMAVSVGSAGGQSPSGATAQVGMLIRTGSASIQVDSLELAIAAVQRLATAFGGYVGNTSLSAGDFQVRSATLELKIPSARFDTALAGLSPIGKVESVTSTAEDVGEEFVDVTARVANARRLEERMVTLLATRTGKLEEVLAVERELSRVREEIERYEGRLRFLSSRVAVSTLSVTVHERAPLVSASPGENVMVDAFRNSWRNLVRFVAGFISLLGIIVPSLALLAIVIAAWRRLRRRSS